MRCGGKNSERRLALTYNNIGQVHLAQNQYEKALKCFKNSMNLQSKGSTNKVYLARTYNFIGDTYLAQGDNKSAAVWYEKSYTIVKEFDARHDVAIVSFNLAQVAQISEERDRAKQYAHESLTIFKQLKLDNKILELEKWIARNQLY